MTSKPRPLREDALRQLLITRGIRVTSQRMVILRELAKISQPISHPELTERLADDELDRATIYRNLLSLTEAGILVRTQLGDNVWRFELPHGKDVAHGEHPHFICTECGDVACLPANTVKLRGDATQREIAEVQLRGRCGTCLRA
jgi:Fur family ferric uptake transcriptional regulator